LRLQFDGAFQFQHGGVLVAASQAELEAGAQAWLTRVIAEKPDRKAAVELMLQAWWCLVENKTWGDAMPNESERQAGWKEAVKKREVEIGWLARKTPRIAKYETLTLAQMGL
jgi:hypothetical protein